MRFLHRLWDWVMTTEPVIYPVAATPRRVPEGDVISGRCWCGAQLSADDPRGWIDAILLHYRECHPDDESGRKLAEDPDRFSADDKFKPKQW